MDDTEIGMNTFGFSGGFIKTEPPDDCQQEGLSFSSAASDVQAVQEDTRLEYDASVDYSFEQCQHIKVEPVQNPGYESAEVVPHLQPADMLEVAQVKAEPVEEELAYLADGPPCSLPQPSLPTTHDAHDLNCDSEKPTLCGSHVILLPDNSTVVVNTIEDSGEDEVESDVESASLSMDPSPGSSEGLTPVIIDVQGNCTFHDFEKPKSPLSDDVVLSPSESHLHLPDQTEEATSPSLWSIYSPFYSTEMTAPDTSPHATFTTARSMQVDNPQEVAEIGADYSQSHSGQSSVDSDCHPEGSESKFLMKILKEDYARKNDKMEFPSASPPAERVCNKSSSGQLVLAKKFTYSTEYVKSSDLDIHYMDVRSIHSYDARISARDEESGQRKLKKRGRKKKQVRRDADPVDLDPQCARDKFRKSLDKVQAEVQQTVRKVQEGKAKVRQHSESVKDVCLAITIGNTLRYRCVMCPEEYSAVGIFYHAKVHRPDLPAVCNGCKSEISSVVCLRNHIQSCQLKLETDSSLDICAVCRMSCKEGIFFHAVKHEMELPARCLACKKPIFSVFDVRQHTRQCQTTLEYLLQQKKLPTRKEMSKCHPNILRGGLKRKVEAKDWTPLMTSRPCPRAKKKNTKARKNPPAATVSRTCLETEGFAFRCDMPVCASAVAPSGQESSKKKSNIRRPLRSTRLLQTPPSESLNCSAELNINSELDGSHCRSPFTSKGKESSQLGETSSVRCSDKVSKVYFGRRGPLKSKATVEADNSSVLSGGQNSRMPRRDELCTKRSADGESVGACSGVSKSQTSHLHQAGSECSSARESPGTSTPGLRRSKRQALASASHPSTRSTFQK